MGWCATSRWTARGSCTPRPSRAWATRSTGSWWSATRSGCCGSGPTAPDAATKGVTHSAARRRPEFSLEALLARLRDPFGWGIGRNRSYTRAGVEAAVAQLFPHEDATAVLAILDEYGREGWQRERARVQLAI